MKIVSLRTEEEAAITFNQQDCPWIYNYTRTIYTEKNIVTYNSTDVEKFNTFHYPTGANAVQIALQIYNDIVQLIV